MSTVEEWLRANKLTPNIAKTRFVIFGSQIIPCHIPAISSSLYGENVE